VPFGEDARQLILAGDVRKLLASVRDGYSWLVAGPDEGVGATAATLFVRGPLTPRFRKGANLTCWRPAIASLALRVLAAALLAGRMGKL